MKLSAVLGPAALILSLTVLVTGQEKQPNGSAGGGAAAGPQLAIESATHDFGEVKTGTPLKWAFKIQNSGTADLLINSVSPG